MARTPVADRRACLLVQAQQHIRITRGFVCQAVRGGEVFTRV